jgi:SAM-dependent methyltransferase
MRFDVCAHTYDEHAGPQRFFAERVAQFILDGGAGVPPARLDFHAASVSRNTDTSTDRRDACPTAILELGAGTGLLTGLLCHALGEKPAPSAPKQPAPDPSLEGIALKGLDGLRSAAAAERPESVPLRGGGRGGSAANRHASILATDASPTMVERGRLAVPQAHWSVLDAFRQPIPVAGLQVSSGLLHWAEDLVGMLVRWKASLAPGGRMVHAVPCEPCLTEWRALVPESPVPWRSEAEWLEIFRRAGLRVGRSQSWRHSAVCPSALEMVRGFHRTGVTGRVRVGPAKLRRALRRYDKQHAIPGGVAATWVWLAVEAVAA